MSYERPPPGIWTPGDASPKTKWIHLIGIVVALVGGIRDKDRTVLMIGIGIVIVGSLVDLSARRGSKKALGFIAVGILAAAYFEITHPALMAAWMGQLGQHANAFLKGGK